MAPHISCEILSWDILNIPHTPSFFLNKTLGCQLGRISTSLTKTLLTCRAHPNTGLVITNWTFKDRFQ